MNIRLSVSAQNVDTSLVWVFFLKECCLFVCSCALVSVVFVCVFQATHESLLVNKVG